MVFSAVEQPQCEHVVLGGASWPLGMLFVKTVLQLLQVYVTLYMLPPNHNPLHVKRQSGGSVPERLGSKLPANKSNSLTPFRFFSVDNPAVRITSRNACIYSEYEMGEFGP